MPGSSLLEELRTQYEAARPSSHVPKDAETFQQIDARLRGSFRWLEKAVTYLDGLKPPIQHRFDLGHGLVFEAPRFGRGSVGQHTRRIVGFPVLDEINVYYEIAAAKGLTIEVAPGGVALAHKTLDDARLTYTSKCFEDADGKVRKCNIEVPPAIPAAVSFRVDYDTGHVAVAMVNVDRIDRVTLDFESKAIDEHALEDLVRLILGQDAAFLRRAPLAGLHGRPAG